MKIRAIRLKEVGRFSEPIALEGLSGGLDVLCGPNELGKSTILKALELALFEQHKAKGKKIEVFRPYRGGAPLVEVDFEIGGVAWRVRKQFLSAPAAELRNLETGSVARGSDADTALAALLAGAGGLPLLWAKQGVLLQGADSAVNGVEAVTAAVESEIKTVADGGAARYVRAKLKEELAAFVTSGRAQPTGVYKTAIEDRQRLLRERDEARTRLERAQSGLDRLADLRERAGALSDPTAVAARREAAAHAREAFETALAARDKFRNAAEVVRAEEARLVAVKQDLASLDGRMADLAKLEEAAQLDAPAIESADKRTIEAEKSARALRERCGALKMATAAAERALKVVAQSEKLQQVSARVEAARTAAAERASAEAQLATITVDEKLVGAVRREISGIATLEARLSAAAPKVAISYAAGAVARIRIGGRVLEDGEVLSPGEPVALEIEGVGVVTVAPGQSDDLVADREDLAAHREQLQALLDQSRIASLEEAEQRLAERRALEAAVADAAARLKAFAPEGMDRLERTHAEIAALMAQEEPAAGESLASLEARTRELAGQLGDAETRLAAAERAQREVREELVRLRTLDDGRRHQIEMHLADLGDAGARLAERTRRAAALSAADVALNAAVRDLAAWREKAPADARLAELKSLVAAAEAARVQAERELGELRQSEAGIEGELKAGRSDDVGARLAELEAMLSVAEGQVRDREREIRALQLLDRELERAEGETRARFSKPVMDRLAPYLGMVFPEAQLAFGDGFSLQKLERSDGAEDIVRLSDGTKEQLAVLVRLAFGRLLAETGAPAPLILDDALVYSDDARIERMFGALQLAAQHHQILVLTCRERTFSALGGNRVAIGRWNA